MLRDKPVFDQLRLFMTAKLELCVCNENASYIEELSTLVLL